MKYIHLIVAGDESIEKHVGGLAHFKPYKVVLFNVADGVESEQMDRLMQRFGSMKIHVRKKDITEKYPEILLAAISEIVGLHESMDVHFAVNVSTGRKIAVAAIEDAVRAPLGMDEIEELHGEPNPIRDAFRYEVVEKDGVFTVHVAPLAGTPGMPLGRIYKMMPIKKKVRLEQLRYLPGTLSIKFIILKNRLKRRLGLR